MLLKVKSKETELSSKKSLGTSDMKRFNIFSVENGWETEREQCKKAKETLFLKIKEINARFCQTGIKSRHTQSQ